jgi:polyhydroxybutyrate depolymerase
MFRMQPTSSLKTPSVWALAWVLLAACGGGAAAEGQRTAGSDSGDTVRNEGSADGSSESDGSGSGDAVSEDTGDDASDGAGSGSGAMDPPYPAGVTDIPIPFGSGRQARLYVPALAMTQPPRALIVVLHGGGGEGLSVSEPGNHPLAEFRTVADREGVVVVYPEGSATRDGRLGWTDCRSDNLQASSDDDLGFLRTVVELLTIDYGLPAERVFMAGGSNGAQMTLAYAAVAPESIAAIATSNGNLPENPLPGPCATEPSQPMPALIAHGSADTVMPFAGGCVANLGGGCSRGRVVGAEATRDAYLRRNGLIGVAPTNETFESDPNDAGTADRFLYDGIHPVVWWRMNGAGHPVASKVVETATTAISGAQNRDVEFAEIAWTFFATQLPE